MKKFLIALVLSALSVSAWAELKTITPRAASNPSRLRSAFNANVADAEGRLSAIEGAEPPILEETDPIAMSAGFLTEETDPIAMNAGFITGNPDEGIVPASDSVHALGDADYKWGELFVNTANASVVNTETLTIDGMPLTLDDDYDLSVQKFDVTPGTVYYALSETNLAIAHITDAGWTNGVQYLEGTGADGILSILVDDSYPFVEGYTGPVVSVTVTFSLTVDSADVGSMYWHWADYNGDEALCAMYEQSGEVSTGDTYDFSYTMDWPPTDCENYFNWGQANEGLIILNLRDGNEGDFACHISDYRIFVQDALTPADEKVLSSPTFTTGMYWGIVDSTQLVFVANGVTNVVDSDVTTP